MEVLDVKVAIEKIKRNIKARNFEVAIDDQAKLFEDVLREISRGSTDPRVSLLAEEALKSKLLI